ncbi:hypothetical protein LguiA_009907 [Lonicera macranthoides]
MSPETDKSLPGNDITAGGLNFKETELTLGLPGESRLPKSGIKRGFSEITDLNLGGGGSSCTTVDCPTKNHKHDDPPQSENSVTTKPSEPKEEVVGWPPVRTFRKNIVRKSSKYVKVGVDGTPYLRKVDLHMYNTYQHLLTALGNMFTCFTIREVLNERKLMDPLSGTEYVPTYEDKDGDWMLVGDVPWKMFVESCKRLRLMKSTEALGLAPKTPPRCSSSSC